MPNKVIISCAVTGAIHTPSMSDYLPITPEEIARSSIEAAEAGAAIIHLHARDPQTGEPTPDPTSKTSSSDSQRTGFLRSHPICTTERRPSRRTTRRKC